MVKLPKLRKFSKGSNENLKMINAEDKFGNEGKKIGKEISDTTLLRSSEDCSNMEFVFVEEEPKVRNLLQ